MTQAWKVRRCKEHAEFAVNRNVSFLITFSNSMYVSFINTVRPFWW